jgi:hypothetical protein
LLVVGCCCCWLLLLLAIKVLLAMSAAPKVGRWQEALAEQIAKGTEESKRHPPKRSRSARRPQKRAKRVSSSTPQQEAQDAISNVVRVSGAGNANDGLETELANGNTLAEGILAGDVPEPDLLSWVGWQKWRRSNSRPLRPGSSHPSYRLFQRREAELWRVTMQKLHGDRWQEALAEQPGSPAVVSAEEVRDALPECEQPPLSAGEVPAAALPASMPGLPEGYGLQFPAGPDVVGTDCLICYSDFQLAEALVRMPCMHMGHSVCVAQWIRKSSPPKCPQCNTSLDNLAYLTAASLA